jgi:excisionase family DNA binding protein
MYVPIGPWLTTAQAAEYLGCGKVMLEEMRASGQGPAATRVGRRFVRYSVKALDSWMQQHELRRADDQQVTP